jgi:Na+/proline symporter
MIISYILGFFATFVACALYNQQCKAGDEISMPQATLSSILWPISLTMALLAIFWNGLEKIFTSISKK